ncbi:hypothetical protein H0H93_014064 [Arthromyces matolae]|nr:hypothetical protein H0H93_014064 [Arthromyces matolae]
MDPNWHPGWAKERRMPDFFEPDPSKPASYSNLGPDQFSYVWGNVPAIDCLNLSNNEGATASTKNFKLCFAGITSIMIQLKCFHIDRSTASGDIRNLVRTVNSLPENYTGQCDILFNDIDPRVVGRNLVVLWALLNPALPIEDVAELAMHLMYSSRLTSPMSAFLSRGLSVIRDLTYGDDLSIPFGGVGKLKAVLMPGNLDIVTEMLESRYGQRAAENSYSFVMCNAARRDYTDRYLDTLEPAHRLAFTHYRSTGILVPFSFNTNDFCEPNRQVSNPFSRYVC